MVVMEEAASFDSQAEVPGTRGVGETGTLERNDP